MLEIVPQDSEKRQYKRIVKTFLARFRMHPQESQDRSADWDIVTVHNLSAGGVLFTYDKEIKIGTQLDFLIPFPGSQEPIDCSGQIIRSEKKDPLHRIAVWFTHMDSQEKARINKNAENTYYKKLLDLPSGLERDIPWVPYKYKK